MAIPVPLDWNKCLCNHDSHGFGWTGLICGPWPQLPQPGFLSHHAQNSCSFQPNVLLPPCPPAQLSSADSNCIPPLLRPKPWSPCPFPFLHSHAICQEILLTSPAMHTQNLAFIFQYLRCYDPSLSFFVCLRSLRQSPDGISCLPDSPQFTVILTLGGRGNSSWHFHMSNDKFVLDYGFKAFYIQTSPEDRVSPSWTESRLFPQQDRKDIVLS